MAEDRIIDVFVDDAGNTGDTIDRVQTNMFLGGIVVPVLRADSFWKDIELAWQRAASVSSQTKPHVELKGEGIYGGKEPFRGVPLGDRKAILDVVFDTVIAYRVPFFWAGVPKHMWRDEISAAGLTPKDVPLWKSSLFTYLGLLYEVLDLLYGGGTFQIVCDENSWIGKPKKDGKFNVLRPPSIKPWPRLVHGGVVVDSSARNPGIQLADLLVHTLYRAYKVSCLPPDSGNISLSNTDRLAASYLQKLVDANLAFVVHQALKELHEKRGTRSPQMDNL